MLGNPFDDIEPRTTRAERQAAAERWVRDRVFLLVEVPSPMPVFGLQA